MNKLSSILLTGLVIAAPAFAQTASTPKPDKTVDIGATPKIMDDPEWQKAFLGSYGFLPSLEPKVNTEELETLRDLIELMKADPKAAAEQLNAAVNENSSAALIFILANLYFQEGELEQAKKYYQLAVEKHPSFRRAHKNLGLLFMQSQDFDKALTHFSRAVELGEQDGRTYGLMAYAYLSNEDYIAAEEAYRDAIQQQPSVTDWKLGLARTLLSTENYEDSIALLNTLIAANPDDATLWLLQSNAYLGMDMPMEAAVNLEAVRALGQPKRSSLLLLGDIYLNLDMPGPALEVYQEAIDSDTENSDYKSAMRAASLLQRTGSLAEAQSLLQGIQSHYSSSLSTDQELELLTLQAKIARRQGEAQKAVELLESIVQRDGTRGEALIELADYYYEKGETELALLKIERAEQLEDFEYEALVKHAQMLAKQRKYNEAAVLLQRALNLKSEPRIERFLAQVKQAARS